MRTQETLEGSEENLEQSLYGMENEGTGVRKVTSFSTSRAKKESLKTIFLMIKKNLL